MDRGVPSGVPRMSDYSPIAKRAKDNVPALASDLVKGATLHRTDRGRPRDMRDREAERRGKDVISLLAKSAKRTASRPADVIKGIDSGTFGRFLSFANQMPQQRGMSALVEVVSQLAQAVGDPALAAKTIALTSPLSTSFAPYDLVAPSRLIYPVYSPFRNKLPRLPGQGTAHRAKVITGISGSHTGGTSPLRWSMGEFNGGSFSAWPNSLPASGTQSAEDVTVNYRFFGLTEAASWLAQFAGQGFEDIAALANLILLQEAMLSEEHMLISGIYNNVAKPAAPTVTARAADTGETAITGATSQVLVKVVAKNYYGATAASDAGSANFTSGVVDVDIAPSAGALQYDIYVTTGTGSGGTYYLVASNVGAARYTIQGALPTGGTQPPTADSGTGSHFDYDGLLAVMTGNTQSGTYPSDGSFTAGYINQSVMSQLTVAVVYDLLAGLYDDSAANNSSANGGYRADPQEIIGEALDLSNLSQNILSQASGGQQAYNLFITQDEADNVRAGAAVSQFLNPFTRNAIRIAVHPWLTQGTAFAFSYQIPMSFSNVGNAWEVRNVQDYVSVAWPVIDPTFRWSIFLYGTLFAVAPQYSGILQGIQRTGSATGGDWS